MQAIFRVFSQSMYIAAARLCCSVCGMHYVSYFKEFIALEWLNLILSAVGGAAAALGVAAWLFRTWLSHRLSVELERYKTQLVQKSEVLKTEMSIYAHEQNVGLSRIDTQRSETILAIWAVLGSWDDVLLNITAPNQSRDFQDFQWALDKYQKWARQLMSISDALSVEVRNRAILVDQATYEVIARCGKAITDASVNFCRSSFEEVDLQAANDLTSIMKRVQHARANLRTAAAKNVEEFRSALLYEFRVLMKAERVANLSSKRTPDGAA